MMEIYLEMEQPQEIRLELEEVAEHYENDYEKLFNLPTLNGQRIIGTMEETDPTVPEWAKNPEPPTAESLGLEEVKEAISLTELENMFQSVTALKNN